MSYSRLVSTRVSAREPCWYWRGTRSNKPSYRRSEPEAGAAWPKTLTMSRSYNNLKLRGTAGAVHGAAGDEKLGGEDGAAEGCCRLREYAWPEAVRARGYDVLIADLGRTSSESGPKHEQGIISQSAAAAAPPTAESPAEALRSWTSSRGGHTSQPFRLRVRRCSTLTLRSGEWPGCRLRGGVQRRGTGAEAGATFAPSVGSNRWLRMRWRG